MQRDPLQSGAWFNSSSRVLRVTAIVIGAGWLATSVATLFFVAQYFACVGYCSPGSSAPLLVMFSILIGLVPALLTAGLGYMIVKGLWDDSKQRAIEAAMLDADSAPTSDTTPASATVRQPTGS
jgi:hypothetical protein